SCPSWSLRFVCRPAAGHWHQRPRRERRTAAAQSGLGPTRVERPPSTRHRRRRLLKGCLKILVLDDVLSPDLASAEPAGTDPTADGFRVARHQPGSLRDGEHVAEYSYV